MDPANFRPVLEFLKDVGIQLGSGAILFIWGLYKEWWVMGSQHRELKETCENYRELAEMNAEVADSGLTIAKRQ